MTTTDGKNDEVLRAALAETAILRAAQITPEWLQAMSKALSKLPVTDALDALGVLAANYSEEDPALPTLPAVLRVIRDTKEPFRQDATMRQIVRKLSASFSETPTEALFQAYWDACGHRTDTDLLRGYAAVLRRDDLFRMPTPGQFLAACGQLTVRRDGSRPE